MSRLTDRFDLIGALADAGETGLDALRQGFLRSEGEVIEINTFMALTKEHCPSIATLMKEQGPDAVRALFHYVDGDGDGLVSWDDVWSYAEGSARQRMETRPAERVHNYSYSRSLRREDNVLHLQYFPTMDRLVTCSRHHPLQLVEPSTLNVQHSFSVAALGGTGVMPESLTFMPDIDTLAAFCSDMRLRLWAFQDASVYPLKPFMCEYRISKLACQRRSPVLFAGDRSGQVTLFDINRQNLNEPRLRDSFPIVDKWPCDEGGIADFVFVSSKEQQLVAALYDNHAITLVDIVNKKWHEIGRSKTAVCQMAHCDTFQCVAVATIDNEVASWVTHQSQSPCTTLSDPSRPHLSRIIGLHHVESSPQVVSTDVGGLIKVWDLRMFRCTQSLMVGSAAEGVDGESESSGSGLSARNAAYNSTCFMNSTREVICADSRGLVCHEYDQNTDPSLADQNETIGLAYNASANTFVTTSASSLSLWDAEAGVLISQTSTNALSVRTLNKKDPKAAAAAAIGTVESFSRKDYSPPKKDITAKIDCHRPAPPRAMPSKMHADITCLCLDGKGRRVFMGTQNGTVHIRSYHGNNLLKRLLLHHGPVVAALYSEQHRALVTCGVDSTVSVFFESELSTPLARVKLGSSPLVALDICPELGLIAAGNKLGRVFVLDMHHPRMIQHDLDPPKQAADVGVRGVAFLARFPLLVVGHQSGRVVVWTVRPVLEAVRVMAFSAFAGPGAMPSPGGPLGHQYHSHGALLADFLHADDDTTATAGDDGAQLTTMVFDQFEHCLIIGNSRGFMNVWSLCPLLRGLDVKYCSYPGTPMFTLAAPPKHERSRMKPTLRASWRAHGDEVVSACAVDIFSLLITAGGDRRICVWKYDGTKCGDLSQGRLLEEAAPRKQTTRVMGQEKQVSSPTSRAKLLHRVMTKIEAFTLLKSRHGHIEAKCVHLLDSEKDAAESPQGSPQAAASGNPLEKQASGMLPTPRDFGGPSPTGSVAFPLQPMATELLDLNNSTMPDKEDLTPVSSESECSSRMSGAPAAEALRRLLGGRRMTARLKPGQASTNSPSAKSASATHNEEHLSTLLGEPLFDKNYVRTPTPPPHMPHQEGNQEEQRPTPQPQQQEEEEDGRPSSASSSSLRESPIAARGDDGMMRLPAEDAVCIPTAVPIAKDDDLPPPSSGDVLTSVPPLAEVEVLPLTNEQVFDVSTQRLREITSAHQLQLLHERRRVQSARGAARVGVARLIEQHPAASGSKRTTTGLIRGMPRSARPRLQSDPRATFKPTTTQAQQHQPQQPPPQSVSPRRVVDGGLPVTHRLKHNRAATKPLGRLIRPKPPPKQDSHTRRLETYEDELKRCLGWNTKDLHEKLADNNTTARNWSTSRLRHELFNTAALTPN